MDVSDAADGVMGWFLPVLVLPLVIALMVAATDRIDQPDATPPDRRVDMAAASPKEAGRLVVVIVDSLRRQNLADDSLMPSLYRFSRRDDTVRVDLDTCKANFTLPCIQTMLEGRESPFVAGLHNFTGQSGSQTSLPATLSSAGYQVALISDHTLDSLYADQAYTSTDVQSWGGKTHLERDLDAIAKGRRILAGDRADALFLHIVGTDKVAHQDHPGTPRYRKEYRTVDRALDGLIASLNFDRDSLVVVGDHGHGPHGNHTHRSVAVFAGASLVDLFGQLPDIETLNQTDLLYFFSYPHLLALPTSYEGRAFMAKHPHGRVARYLKLQRHNLQAAGAPAKLDFQEGLAHLRKTHRADRFDPILEYAPLLLLFGLFVAGALGALRGGPGWDDIWILVGLLVASLPIALWTDPTRGPWLSVPILIAGGWAGWRQKSLRAHAFMVLVCGGAILTAVYAGPWADYFHTTGGFKPALAVFYAGLFGSGAILAAVLFGGLRRLPYGAMAAAFFVLPGGLYYYQASQNILFGCFVGAIPLGMIWAVRALVGHSGASRRANTDPVGRSGRLAALLGRLGPSRAAPWTSAPPLWLSGALTGVIGLFLLWQEAGGWQWHLQAVRWMQQLGPSSAWGVLVVLVVYWVWAANTTAQRLAAAGFCAAATAYSVGLGELAIEHFVGAMLPAFFLAALLDVRAHLADPPARAEALTLCRGLLVAALMVISLWVATTGFLFQNLDFSFALDWFNTVFSHERNVFVWSYAATFLKYGLPPAAVAVALETVGRGTHPGRSGDFRAVMASAVAWLVVDTFTLLVQVFAGSTSPSQKYNELMLSELTFVFPLAVAAYLGYLAIRGAALAWWSLHSPVD